MEEWSFEDCGVATDGTLRLTGGGWCYDRSGEEEVRGSLSAVSAVPREVPTRAHLVDFI